MRSSLIIIMGIRAAVVAGIIDRGTAEGLIEKIISEMVGK
jgi:hypothetical protein